MDFISQKAQKFKKCKIFIHTKILLVLIKKRCIYIVFASYQQPS